MTRLSALMIVVAVGLGGAATRATAQPASAEAETLFRQGRELLAAGKLEQACGAFESSQKLAPAPTTQLNLADCREKLGQLATAWGVFVEVGREVRDAKDASSKKLAKVAATHAAKLEPRLSKLTIKIAQDRQLAGLEIHRGADVVDSGAWNVTLPVDGGTYVISAHAPNHDDWSANITIKAEHDDQTVEIPMLPAAKVIPVAVVTPTTTTHATTTTTTGTAPTAEVTAPVAHRSLEIGVAVGGVAIVLAAAAVGFDAWGSSTYKSAQTEPDLATQTSEWHSANDKRYAADALGVAAVAGAGVAIWLFVRGGGSDSEPSSSEAHVVPMVSGDRAGLAWSGQF